MAKKYVPEGAFLACDKGTSPSTLRVSNNKNTTIYSAPMASELDFLPFFNIKPMGLCTNPLKWATGVSCLPTVPTGWQAPKDGVKINGSRMLLEDSFCNCIFGGKINIFFDRAAAVSYGVGEGKMPSDYIKEGFDWIAEQNKKSREMRDQMLPDWMKPVTGVGDWFSDLGTGLVEGAVNGVVGLGETLYQVGQDPVGTAEALGGMVSDGWNAATEGVGNAWDWASKGENWSNAAEGAWNWASDGQNWADAGNAAWEGTKDAASWVAENPRKIGTTVGEFIPDAVAAVYSGGTSLAATAGKTVLKEGGEAVVEKTVKNVTEEAVEQGVKKGDDLLKAGAEKGIVQTMKQIAEGGNIAKVITKSAAEKAKELLDDVLKKFDPKKATNKQKGNFGEIASQNNLLKNNPNLKRIGDNAPGSLDDKIKKGIDGIYENSSPPPKFIIDEAKYGTSDLSKTPKDGPQMSDSWIKGSKRLENQVGPAKAREIEKALKNGEVDRVLSKVDSNGNVTTYKIDKKGDVIGPWP
ncbi:PAAR-like protein [Chryseobacterium sp. MIQD13]|uniref:PAAR-like protein n=1 Tax=Chryseobacterium sp. MIQD13 TaxID=3422310 RepID=UPI003D2D5B10